MALARARTNQPQRRVGVSPARGDDCLGEAALALGRPSLALAGVDWGLPALALVGLCLLTASVVLFEVAKEKDFKNKSL